SSLPQEAKAALEKLSAAISAQEMQEQNAMALFENKSHAEIAYRFLVDKKLIAEKRFIEKTLVREILDKTFVHLKLTLLSLLAAILIALPLGIFLYRHPSFSNSILYTVGI